MTGNWKRVKIAKSEGNATIASGIADMKDMLFYSVVGTVIGLIAQALGANIAVILLSSLLIPPIILLVIRILRR